MLAISGPSGMRAFMPQHFRHHHYCALIRRRDFRLQASIVKLPPASCGPARAIIAIIEPRRHHLTPSRADYFRPASPATVTRLSHDDFGARRADRFAEAFTLRAAYFCAVFPATASLYRLTVDGRDSGGRRPIRARRCYATPYTMSTACTRASLCRWALRRKEA